MVKVTVSKLDTPYKAGDWHDPAFKWTVRGPGTERQDFSNKKNAMLYAKLRRNSASQTEAGNKYVRAA
jgi:hypothetical protein